jgi:hypothetical protein
MTQQTGDTASALAERTAGPPMMAALRCKCLSDAPPISDIDCGIELYFSYRTPFSSARRRRRRRRRYSTVTDFARFRGWSTLEPRLTAM